MLANSNFLSAYINMRLPEHLRWKEAAVNHRIYNVCRRVNRNRTQEAENRVRKIAAGIQIKKRKKKEENKENEQLATFQVSQINIADMIKLFQPQLQPTKTVNVPSN